MCADVCSRPKRYPGRLILAMLLPVLLAACKTEKDPDDPTILGVPPATAYLGVEYYYNFGAYGGEGILDYSLTNAPSWLALEDISNKARQGIIIRGVPGLTGGERGAGDLGTTRNINLVTTDGRMAGVQPFDINVKENNLSLSAEVFTEGKAGAAKQGVGEHCELPDLENSGEHNYDINLYDDSGVYLGTEARTSETYPVLVRVMLERPSVTRVQVAWELRSGFDPLACDPTIVAPHQRCEHSRQNTGDAIIDRDVIAWGSGSGNSLPAPDYLTYQADEQGRYTRGVITIEPGIRECYIRLEVVEDSVPEPSEVLELALTEVRSGLAGLGGSSKGVRTSVIIDDNEPKVALKTVMGGDRDVINVGSGQEYLAVLSKPAEITYRARIGRAVSSVAQPGADYLIEIQDVATGTWLAGDIVEFPAGQVTARFRVSVPAASYSNPSDNDKAIELAVDDAYQAGRENFAGSDASLLRIGINELTTRLLVGGEGVFIPSDLAVGHDGRVFVAGYNPAAANQAEIHVYSQKGEGLGVLTSTAPVDPLAGPVLDYSERRVKEGDQEVLRRELVLVYGTRGTLAGSTNAGGVDSVVSLFRYDPASAELYPNVWSQQAGTAGDDIPRWGAADSFGNIFVTGETTGQWPGETQRGGRDSYVQRIDSVDTGTGPAPVIAWTRQAGSALEDTVAGGATFANSGLVFGSTAGTLEGQPTAGMTDLYLYSAFNADSDLTVYQRGSDADDLISSGVYSGGTLWLLGNGDGRYEMARDEGVADDSEPFLSRDPLQSTAGFLLGYSTTGGLVAALTLNDMSGETDIADEHYSSLVAFDGDVVVGGLLDNAAGLARTGVPPQPEASPEVPEEETTGEDAPPESTDTAENSPIVLWYQWLGVEGTAIQALANYRDDEITSLVTIDTTGGRFWELLIFSGEGRLLNGANPE